MGTYDNAADILFHAAMSVGAGRKNTVMGAIYHAYQYLGEHVMHPDKTEAINLYMQLNGHLGQAWQMFRGPFGGTWMAKIHLQELILSLLFTYEYMIQEMGAARSPMDLGYS